LDRERRQGNWLSSGATSRPLRERTRSRLPSSTSSRVRAPSSSAHPPRRCPLATAARRSAFPSTTRCLAAGAVRLRAAYPNARGWLASARRRWRGRCGGEGKGGLGGTAGCSLARPSERVGSPGAVRFLDVRSPSWQVILHLASNCNSPRAREARVVNAHMTSYKAGSDPCCDAAFGAPNILDSRMYTFTRIENPSLPAAGGPAGPRHALSDKPKCSDTYLRPKVSGCMLCTSHVVQRL